MHDCCNYITHSYLFILDIHSSTENASSLMVAVFQRNKFLIEIELTMFLPKGFGYLLIYSVNFATVASASFLDSNNSIHRTNSSSSPVNIYTNVQITPEEGVRIDYLAPLIAILLATLLSIISLFSCVLCTCSIREHAKMKSQMKNEPMAEKPPVCSDPTETSSLTSPKNSKRKKREYIYRTLPVILAYQKAELHAEGCPHYQSIANNIPTESITWNNNRSYRKIKINTKDKSPWNTKGRKSDGKLKVRESVSETEMDRITVV